MEIDVSALGPLSTAFAALFSKLGVPIKTSVPLPVLEAARSGSFRAEPLPFGAAVAGRVDKHACRFYAVRACEWVGWGSTLCTCSPTRCLSFRPELLPFGAAVAGRVDKRACRFYAVRAARACEWVG